MARALALLLALTGVGSPARAHSHTTPLSVRAGPSPADLERAKSLYDEGVKLYRRGEYEAAIEAFEQSFALSGDRNQLYNISLAHDRLGDFENAIATLDRYRALAPESEWPEIDEKRRSLELRLERKEREEGLESPPPVETEPEQPTPPPDEPPTQETPQDQPTTRARPIMGAAGWTLTGVAVVGWSLTIGFGAASLSRTRAAERNCDTAGGDQFCLDSGREDAEQSRQFALASDISLGIAAAATVAVVTLVAVRTARRKKQTTSLTPFLAPTRAGLALTARC